MEETALFTAMAILIVLASFSAIILGKLKLPSIIGFLVTGIVVVNYIGTTEEISMVVDIFSDLGLVMLLFIIGLEIDISKLRTQGKFAILIALIQIPVMLFTGMIVGSYMGYNTVQSVTFGAILSGASTAVVLAVLKSNNVLDHGKMDILVLVMIIEDISQVIMISLLTPMMKGETLSTDSTLVLFISIAVFMIVCSTLGLRIVPKVIDWFYAHSNGELISLLCIGLLFVVSLIANMVGLSVAIGAFLTGLMVSLSKPKHVVEEFVNPMKTLFMGMFFISVGAKVSVDSLIANLPMVLTIYVLFAVAMFLAVNTGYWVAGGDPRSGWISALSMCTMGEFAFIISKQAFDYGVFDQAFYSSIIGAAIVSMLILPLLVRTSERTYGLVYRMCPNLVKRGFGAVSKERDLVYHGLSVVSYKTKDRFANALTNAAFLFLLVIAIEVVFFFAYTPLSIWLSANFGNTEDWWRIAILFANVLALLEPCRRLAKFFQFIIYLRERGEAHLRSDYMNEVESPFAYRYLSTLAVGAAVDVLIVIIVPNGIDNLMHVIVLLAVLVVVLIYQYFAYRKKLFPSTTQDIEGKSQK